MIATLSEKHAKDTTTYYGEIADAPDNCLLSVIDKHWTYIQHYDLVLCFTNNPQWEGCYLEFHNHSEFVYNNFETRKPGTVFTFTQL